DSDDARQVHDRPSAAPHHPAGRGPARMEHTAEVRAQNGVPILVRHPRDQAVTGESGVVDQDVELARLLDQPGGLRGVGDVRLDRPPADLLRQSLGLVGPAPVADDDLRTGPRELRGDRAADPARGAGDERELAFERAERPRTGAACHAVAIDSSIFSSEARSLTEIAFTLRSIRLTRPDRTFPGPTSTNVRTPSRTNSEAACVNRTGAVSWPTSNAPMRCAYANR